MRSLTYNRRQSDEGYHAQRRSPLQLLRTLLRMRPATDAVEALSHWRRRAARVLSK